MKEKKKREREKDRENYKFYTNKVSTTTEKEYGQTTQCKPSQR